jgi:hypothetical protein
MVIGNCYQKELVETRGWLKFIILAQLLPARRIKALLEECLELCRILGKSVSTAKTKSKPRPPIAQSTTNEEYSI